MRRLALISGLAALAVAACSNPADDRTTGGHPSTFGPELDAAYGQWAPVSQNGCDGLTIVVSPEALSFGGLGQEQVLGQDLRIDRATPGFVDMTFVPRQFTPDGQATVVPSVTQTFRFEAVSPDRLRAVSSRPPGAADFEPIPADLRDVLELQRCG